ncbi:Tfp pilus assembly protein FimT/FimU [Patescibacteria group bacterium]
MLKDKQGFTLIELLIVIGITLLLAAASVPIYGNLQVSSQMHDSVSQIAQTIRTARVRSVARLNNSSHGVYLEINAGSDDRFILYQGSSYIARDIDYDRAISLDEALSISSTFSNNDINFSRGFGTTTAGMLTVTHDTGDIANIIVNVYGMAEEN